MLLPLPRRLELFTPRTTAAVVPALGVLALCVACSSGDGKSDGAAGATGTGGDASGSGGSSTSGGSSSGGSGSGAEDPAVGTFTVNVVPPVGSTVGSTGITGAVQDGVPAEDVIWEITLEEGGCRLLEPTVPFCDPACVSSICVADGVCRETPPRINVGTVTITGLATTAGGNEVTIEPIGDNPMYNSGTPLIYPPFAEGDPVVLSATGQDDIPAFQIESHGISPLEMITTGDIPLESGQPISLEWTPPSLADISTIRAIVDISHHGGQKGEIVCDVPDSGSLEIPAALATRLLELGYSGYPEVSVERRVVGSTNIPAGRVDLIVVSRQRLFFSIAGLISCPDIGQTTGCPAGQVCQQDMQCG